MICQNCGRECLEGKFCSECGYPLEAEQEKKAALPSLEELRDTVISIEKEAHSNQPTVNEGEGVFYIERAEYDNAMENMDGFKKKARVPFYLFFISVGLSLASFFSFLYLFTDIGGSLELVSILSAYLNIPAFIVSLVSFAIASHWFLAAREYKFLKRPAFISWTFVLSILGVVFCVSCLCAVTFPIMLF